MKRNTGAFILLGSIVLSSALTYILTKAKYEKGFRKETPKVEPKKNDIPLQVKSPANEKDDITKYAEKYKQKNEELLKRYSPNPGEHPTREFIDEDIFDTESDDFEKIGFTLFADDILVDENNSIVTDYENNVGIKAIEEFNEHETNGAVYVRNYETQSDYEILRDLRPYTEVVRRRTNGRS